MAAYKILTYLKLHFFMTGLSFVVYGSKRENILSVSAEKIPRRNLRRGIKYV